MIHFIDAEQLLGTRYVDDFQMRDSIEDGDIVVAHVGRAIGPCFEIRSGGEERQVESMSLAQPAVWGLDRFEPLWCPTAMRRSTFQSKNGQKVLTGIKTSAAKASRSPSCWLRPRPRSRLVLVYGGDAGQPAGGSEVGIDGNHSGSRAKPSSPR